MPKAVATSQSPSSPGSSGAASVKERSAAKPSSEEVAGSRPAFYSSDLRGASAAASINGRVRTLVPFDIWPAELDGYLKEVLPAKASDERQVIATLRASHPELPEELIWSRIAYLGLTDRKRRPYQRHEWTDVEDQILRSEYGRSRACSRNAIDKVLALHPDWSRDAVVWRARVLGLAQHRATPPEPWSSTLEHYLLSLMGCQLETIARRLKRSEQSVIARLRRLGWGADFFGGFKTKDLVLDLRVSEAQVSRWVRCGWLERKKGRITEDSLRWFCRHHPEEIPFDTLAPETQNWLKLSMDYGRGNAVRHGGRRKKSPQSEAPAARTRRSDESIIR